MEEKLMTVMTDDFDTVLRLAREGCLQSVKLKFSFNPAMFGWMYKATFKMNPL